MLTEKDKISFEQMIQDKYSTRSELADQVLGDLIAAARKSDSASAKKAADVLEKWDRQFNADSRGAVLFGLWYQSYGTDDMKAAIASGTVTSGVDLVQLLDRIYAKSLDEKDVLGTPSGLSNPQVAVATLAGAADQLEKMAGSLDVTGQTFPTVRRGSFDFPGDGSSGQLGVFRVMEYMSGKDGLLVSAGGDIYVAAVEFSNPVKAMVITTYGNSTQPGSLHLGDQLELSTKKELRPAWLTRAAIEANLESRKVFN